MMTTKTCPLCGEPTLEEKRGVYRFDPPPKIPGGTIVIADAEWQGCAACGEDILPHELSTAIDAEADRRRGLGRRADAVRPVC
jgi:YgiT-type zinc finger domain-containing protein